MYDFMFHSLIMTRMRYYTISHLQTRTIVEYCDKNGMNVNNIDNES